MAENDQLRAAALLREIADQIDRGEYVVLELRHELGTGAEFAVKIKMLDIEAQARIEVSHRRAEVLNRI